MTESIITDEEVKEPKKTKHDQDYEALIARRDTERVDEVQPEESQDEPQEEPPEPESIELVGEDGNVIKVPIKAKYKAKVDGNEVEVPFEQLTRSYQIGAAADRRMKSVSDKQKELEEKEQALNARGQELESREKAYLDKQQELDEKKESGQIDDSRYEELSKKLLSALTDEDDPETALKSVLKDMVQPQQQIDVGKVAADASKEAIAAIEERERKRQEEAEAKRVEQLEKSRLEANEKFEAALDNEFKILKEDPNMMRLAKSYANEEYHSNPDADPWDVICGAVDKVKEFKAKISVTDKKPSPTPRSVSARASIGEDKKPQTRADILNQMKQSRGQPAMQ